MKNVARALKLERKLETEFIVMKSKVYYFCVTTGSFNQISHELREVELLTTCRFINHNRKSKKKFFMSRLVFVVVVSYSHAMFLYIS